MEKLFLLEIQNWHALIVYFFLSFFYIPGISSWDENLLVLDLLLALLLNYL